MLLLLRVCKCGHKLVEEIVGNKAKGRISKRVLQEHKSSQIFRKTEIFTPLICTYKCAYQGVRNVRFSENLASFVMVAWY